MRMLSAAGGVHHDGLRTGQLQVVAQTHGRQLLAQQIAGQLVLGGQLAVLLLHVLVRYVDALQPGDLRHGQLEAGGGDGLLPGVGAEILHGCAAGLQILLQLHTLALQMAAQLLDQTIQLVFHHGVGQLHLHALQHLTDQVVGELLGGLHLLFGHGLLHHAAAQLGQPLKALRLGKRVVQRGHGAAGDLVDGDAERGVLAGQFRRVGGGEGDVDIPLLADAGAGHLLLEAGDEVAAAQQQGIVLALAALEGHAVHEALEVQHHLVAHGGAVGMLGGHVGAGILLHSGLGVLLGQLGLGIHGAEALVLPQLHLGIQVDEGGEREAVGADLLHRQGGGAGDGDVLPADGLHQRLGIRLVHGLLIEKVGAVGGLDLLAGRLPLHRAQGLDAVVAVHQRGLPCVAVYGDGQAHLTVFRDIFTLFDLHGGSPPCFGTNCQYIMISILYPQTDGKGVGHFRRRD